MGTVFPIPWVQRQVFLYFSVSQWEDSYTFGLVSCPLNCSFQIFQLSTFLNKGKKIHRNTHYCSLWDTREGDEGTGFVQPRKGRDLVCSHLRRGHGVDGNTSKKTVIKGPQWEAEKHRDGIEVFAVWLACLEWEVGPEAPWGLLPPGDSAEQVSWLPWQIKRCFPQKG